MFGGKHVKAMIVNYDLAWNHYIKNTGADEAYAEYLFILQV